MPADDQDLLLRWTLAALSRVDAQPRGEAPISRLQSGEPPHLPAWPLERFAAAGFASGLTALIGALATAEELPAGVADYIGAQRTAVAARSARFRLVTMDALAVLDRAGVAATPVKGAVLANELWPVDDARPMADVDLLVDPWNRRAAATAVTGLGWPLQSSAPWEDTFVAWPAEPDATADGESAGHAGKVEIHPGWVERLHGYEVDGTAALRPAAGHGELLGVPCSRLDDDAFAVHVVGHLATTVVRAETRPLHVVDAVVVLDRLDADDWAGFAAIATIADPRLTAPGLWLVDHYRPGLVPPGLLRASLDRLPVAARRALARTPPMAVLRGGMGRTTIGWRSAFTRTAAERRAVLRQATWPSLHERGTVSPWPAQAARLRRGAARLIARARDR